MESFLCKPPLLQAGLWQGRGRTAGGTGRPP